MWTPRTELARRALGDVPWRHYLQTAVEFEAAGHRGTMWPLDGGEGGGDAQLPLGPVHVVTAVQPDTDPAAPDNLARMCVLDGELHAAGVRSTRAVGISFDSRHREESRAVFGLNDNEARALGLRFGQVAVFGWNGPRWSLLACTGDRQSHRGWRWEEYG